MSAQVAAVIGVGFIGAAHVEALRRIGVEVAGVAGSSPARSEEAARALGLSAYPDWRAAVADPRVTVVHDCGPNDLHLELNLAALAAGKHVFAEKPLGNTPDETARQLEAARVSGLRHAVHFTYRGYAMVHELRERILRGDLGEVRFVRGRYLQDWLLFPNDYNWRLEAKPHETRVVADIGSHVLDLTRFVTGLEPRRLLARFFRMHETRYRPTGSVQSFSGPTEGGEPYAPATEDHATMLVEYDGVSGNFEVSQVAAGRKNDLTLEVFGTRASATWSQERPEELVLGYRDRPNETLVKSSAMGETALRLTHYPPGHPEGYPDAITNVVRAFYRSLSGQEQPYPTFEDGHAAALAIAAAARSNETGGWVEVGGQGSS